jgi:hypothetical protein
VRRRIMTVKEFAIQTIKKYPKLKENIIDAYALMVDEIEDGESEDMEEEHFYSYVKQLRGEQHD